MQLTEGLSAQLPSLLDRAVQVVSAICTMWRPPDDPAGSLSDEDIAYAILVTASQF